MPKLAHRKPYDDDGNEMREGLLVLVNGKFTRVLHFDDNDEIDIADFHWDDVVSIEKMPDDRYETIADETIS